MVSYLFVVAGICLVGLALWDVFHTMVLPRTLGATYRLTPWFYRVAWPFARRMAKRMPNPRKRDSFLAIFGPASLLLLIVCWVVTLIVGFAMLQWGVEVLAGYHRSAEGSLYLSGTTFFTLGLGDEKPLSWLSRLVTVLEAGTGFAVLAAVIGYLPVLHQAFSNRELEIALLASRAGHPSTAAGFLTRLGRRPNEARMVDALIRHERWCAEIIENHGSYPMLAYYRSQHDRQSWLGSITTLLDACAILQIGFEEHPEWRDSVEDQAELTFAMGCAALVRLSTVLDVSPAIDPPDRLRSQHLDHLRHILRKSGLHMRFTENAQHRLDELRQLYEPYIAGLSDYLLIELPPFIVAGDDFEPTTPEAAVRDAFELH